MKIITTHFNPDYDALASAIGLKKIYPDAFIVLNGTTERSMKNFFIQTIIYSLDILKINEVNLDEVEQLIIADTSRSDRIGVFSEILTRENLEIIIYDHHFEEDNINTEKKFLKKRGACTTIVVELLNEKNIEVTDEEATILMMGIYEDTGNLTFNTTTEFDYYAAAFLLKSGANLNTVRDILYHDITIEQVNLLKQFIDSEEIIKIRGVNISLVQAFNDEYINEAATVIHKYKDMKNAQVVIAIMMFENKVYLISRSSSKEIDVKKIAEYFGGGGHESASSAIVRERTVIQVYNEIKAYLLSIDVPGIKAKTIMTSPVIHIFEDDTILFADEILNRYNINVLPVMDRVLGKIIGLVTRQIIGKSIYHNLKELPVTEYMLKEFHTVTPDDNIDVVKDIILKQNQRLLPVVDESGLVGVITRTDMLKTIYEIESKNNFVQVSPTQRDIKNLLKNQISEDILLKLEKLGEIAGEQNYKIYVVGGFVRDIMLQKDTVDIDLVIEGNGIKFAKFAKQKLPEIVKIKTYEKFKTAKIFFDDNSSFDIATARLEYYKKPGSLPIVEKSSLKMDLYRRDFTINTMAIDISKEHFGQMIDFFGGLKDIKEKKIRIIHNLSFVEDPTRIFRAFRFSLRFGFEIGKQTESLIKNANNLNLLNTVSGARIFHEIEAIFNEDKVIDILIKLNSYNLLKMVFPKCNFNQKFINFLNSIYELAKWYKITFPNESISVPFLYFSAFLQNMSREEIIDICEKFFLSSKEALSLIKIIDESKIILKHLISEKSIDKYALYILLMDKKAESIILSLAKNSSEDVRNKVIKFLISERFIKPILNGDSLIEMGLTPSHTFKEIFEGIVKNKLLGNIRNINEEKDYVIKNFIQK